MQLSPRHRTLLERARQHRDVIDLSAPERDDQYPAFALELEALSDLVSWGLAEWVDEGLVTDYTRGDRYQKALARLTEDGIAEADKRRRG
jgi:hypothetical protein